MNKGIKHVVRFMNPLPDWKIIGYYDVLEDKPIVNPRDAWSEIIMDESDEMHWEDAKIKDHRMLVKDANGNIFNYNILTNELYNGNILLNKKVYALTYIDGYLITAYGKRMSQKFFKRFLQLKLPLHYSPESTLYYYREIPYTMMELVDEARLDEDCKWLRRNNKYYCATDKEQILKFTKYYMPEYQNVKSDILEIVWENDLKMPTVEEIEGF